MDSSNACPVLVHSNGPTTTISLNRPEVLNAMNDKLLEALLGALEDATSERDCRVIILTGAGSAFCSGDDLSFGLENVNGPCPIAAQTGRLRRYVVPAAPQGPARARRVLLDPLKHTAMEVLNFGIVDEVVAAAEVLPAARALAARLMTRASVSLRAEKHGLVESSGLSLTEHLDREAVGHASAYHPADANEAAAAFLEKRTPSFSEQ